MGPCVPCTPGVEAGARKGLGGPAPPFPGLRRRGRRSCRCRHRELWRSEGPGASEGAGAAPGGVSAVPTVVLCGLEKQRRSQGLRRLRPGKAFWAGEQRCEGGRRGRGWGAGRRAARGSAGGERWALLLGSPSCSAQTSSSLLPLPTLSQSSCAASFGKPPLVSLTEAALLLRPVALTSAEMRVFVGSYVSPRPHSHSHTHTRL